MDGSSIAGEGGWEPSNPGAELGCPHCGEVVNAADAVCPWCGEAMDPEPHTAETEAARDVTSSISRESVYDDVTIRIVAVVAGGALLLAAISLDLIPWLWRLLHAARGHG